ncbi:MAG: exo-beta-N-acetylmuramidase NamZ domain-containing protein [Cyclonatronaceae bacterium]
MKQPHWMRTVTLCLIIFSGITLSSCDKKADQPEVPVVTIGAKILADSGFAGLHGKRVGLITNHTSMIGEHHLADLMHANTDILLVALFAPEHGIRGTADAGAVIESETDQITGLPVYSLHGDTYKPTPEMLENIDILVFDMQDVGTRFYTYISTMGFAMQAAAQAGIEFLVLDRPNPIGGIQIEGFTLEAKHRSFIGMYEIPATHGMTIGEIALMIKGIPLLEGLDSLKLNIIRMEGWKRQMLWPDTGLKWIPPSPNIPDFETAVIYPGACFFGSTASNEGRITPDTAAQAASGSIEWKSKILAPGIVWQYAEPDSLYGAPQFLTMLVMHADTAARLVRFVTAGDVMPDSMFLRPSDFAGLIPSTAVVNGGFFSDHPEYVNSGIFKWKGRVYPFMKQEPEELHFVGSSAVGISEQGEWLFANRGEPVWPQDWPEAESAIAGAHRLLDSGEIPEPVNSENWSSEREGRHAGLRHPRTALCQTMDNRIILMVADGRHEQARGLTLKELAELLLQLGCRDAINLDGGGSSTMHIEGEGVVNHPSDNRTFDHAGERAVRTVILILKSEPVSRN